MLLFTNLTTLELANKAGVTERTVRWYMEQGLVNPINPGEKRLKFSQEDADKIKLIKYLQDKEGLSLTGIKVMILERGEERENEFFSKLKQLSEGSDPSGSENVYSHILDAIREAENKQAIQSLELEDKAVQLEPELSLINGSITDPMSSSNWSRIVISQGVELQVNEQQILEFRKEINSIISFARDALSNHS